MNVHRLRALLSSLASTTAVIFTACVVHPPEAVYPVTVSSSVSDTYVCAIRAVNDVQYSIATADRASGVFRAQRSQPGGLYVDRLSVSVYPDTLGHTQLRVVADAQ